MKRIQITLAAIALMFCCTSLQAQMCPGALLTDDFSNPLLWTSLGTTTATSGDITVTGGVAFWNDMTQSVNQRIMRDVGTALPNTNLWRIEWEFNMETPSTCIGADIMAVTSNSSHPRFANPGGGPPTDNNTVEVLVGSPNCNTSVFYFLPSSKFGTVRTNAGSNIPFNANTTYYLRLQRTSPAQAVLSVYSDAARTNHIPNSPLCFTVDSQIDSLRYIQMGLWTSSNPARRITASNDNMCIYGDVTKEGCDEEPCNAEPDITVTVDPQTCLVTFTDNTVFGIGTTPLANYAIDFGDGSTGQLAPGGSVTHFYPSGTYQFCVYIFAYDQNFECCSFKFCDKINIECEIEQRRAAPDTQEEMAPVKNIELFPNPSNQMVNIRSEKTIKSLRIYDPSGRVIRTENGMDKNAMELNVEDLSNGIYFFEINLGDEVVTEKFSKIQ